MSFYKIQLLFLKTFNHSISNCSGQTSLFHDHAKHIDIYYHFVQKQVALGTVKLTYYSSTDVTVHMLKKDKL